MESPLKPATRPRRKAKRTQCSLLRRTYDRCKTFRQAAGGGSAARGGHYSGYSAAQDGYNAAAPGRVRLNFKHYPLTGIHPWSLTAAAYADCAGKQGRFWEYGKLLFEGQDKWGKAAQKPAQFEEYASSLGLDYAELDRCAGDPETLKAVRLDMAEGELKKIESTPTFLINKRRAVGGQQLLKFAEAFENLETREPVTK